MKRERPPSLGAACGPAQRPLKTSRGKDGAVVYHIDSDVDESDDQEGEVSAPSSAAKGKKVVRVEVLDVLD